MTAQILSFKHAQPAISDACKWSAAFEQIASTHLRIAFAWQRTIMRMWLL